MADYGKNQYSGASSLTPGETTASAEITRTPDATLAHVKRKGSATADRPDVQPLSPTFGHRDRNAETPVKIPGVLSRK